MGGGTERCQTANIAQAVSALIGVLLGTVIVVELQIKGTSVNLSPVSNPDIATGVP
jgi:hypothetical protein